MKTIMSKHRSIFIDLSHCFSLGTFSLILLYRNATYHRHRIRKTSQYTAQECQLKALQSQLQHRILKSRRENERKVSEINRHSWLHLIFLDWVLQTHPCTLGCISTLIHILQTHIQEYKTTQVNIIYTPKSEI